MTYVFKPKKYSQFSLVEAALNGFNIKSQKIVIQITSYDYD